MSTGELRVETDKKRIKGEMPRECCGDFSEFVEDLRVRSSVASTDCKQRGQGEGSNCFACIAVYWAGSS